MTKTEVRSKFDEIVDFSGVAKYIDTPIKRYSSGMYVRLAFAVAAYLDPEILIVDEVLAVGDAEFQKKALGKMRDVSSKQGRTVLFVSHNMTAIKNLCKKGLCLNNGLIVNYGEINSVVGNYLSNNNLKGFINNEWEFDNAPGTDKLKVNKSYIQFEGDIVTVKTPFDIVTEFWCLEEGFPINVSMHLFDNYDNCIFNITTHWKPLQTGIHKAEFHIPGNLMNDGIYYVNFFFRI